MAAGEAVQVSNNGRIAAVISPAWRGRLRSNVAIHLAVALRVAADEMLTYDTELTRAATDAGVAVAQPG